MLHCVAVLCDLCTCMAVNSESWSVISHSARCTRLSQLVSVVAASGLTIDARYSFTQVYCMSDV